LALHELTINEVHKLLQKREISSEELTRDIIKQIKNVDNEIKAFVTLDEEGAIEASRKIDKNGEYKGPLSGIPVAVKDNICTKNILTTCSSKMLENFIPPYDATVIKKLKEQSSFVLGKTNMDEFAMGSSTEKSALFATKNPWDLERVPGGSSGGSAAAVAADECIYALGTDTGGSIRQPASYCGLVGLKPTYGRVSRYGLIAHASSLDQIGPITKNVADCATVLEEIAGEDKLDVTSSSLPVGNYSDILKDGIKGAKLGIPKELLGESVDPDVREAVLKAAKTFEELGAICEETTLPNIKYAIWAYYIISAAEASSNLARYDGIRFGYRAEHFEDLTDLYKRSRGEGFGPEVKRRIILGTFLSSEKYYDEYYLKALKARSVIKQDFDKIFDKYDLLITPTVPTVAFKIGEEIDDPLKMYMNDLCTTPVNLANLPAITLPCGFSEGLPIGLQIIGRAFDEANILKAAYTFEQNTDFHKMKNARREG